MHQLKITQRGLDWLAQTEDFRVLHHFDHVCNLINPSNQILAMHTAEIGMGPFSCLIEPAYFRQITSAESIRLGPTKGQFLINDHLFSTEGCLLWHARPDWESLDWSLIVDVEHQLSNGVHGRMQALHQAIFANNNQAIRHEAMHLAGRGIGLTPEGDDVLLGTIHALHVLGWDQAVIQMIGEAATGRTTSLSAAFLQAAVAGEATEHWHDLLEGKTGTLNRLLSVGATSGKDAWLGFTATYKAYKEHLAAIPL